MMFPASSAFARCGRLPLMQQPANAAIAQEGTGAAQAVYDDYGDEEPAIRMS